MLVDDMLVIGGNVLYVPLLLVTVGVLVDKRCCLRLFTTGMLVDGMLVFLGGYTVYTAGACRCRRVSRKTLLF